MKKALFICFLVPLFFWPQPKARTQMHSTQQELAATIPPDTLDHINKKVKEEILNNFSCLESEINRISHLRKKYVLRTHTRRETHYRIDTVMLFIDTCYQGPDTTLFRPDTVFIQKTKPNFFNKIFKNLFHKKTPHREDYIRVVPSAAIQ